MATITERDDYQFQAIIRRKGYPAQTKTFESRADAERWVREVEANFDTGYFRDRREGAPPSVKPTKRGMVAEKNRILKLQSNPISLRPLAIARLWRQSAGQRPFSRCRRPMTVSPSKLQPDRAHNGLMMFSSPMAAF